jgi:PAS domain S-box-containing protein
MAPAQKADFDFLFYDHPVPMWIIAKEGHYIRALNKSAVLLLKRLPEEIIGQSLNCIFPGIANRISQWQEDEIQEYRDCGVLTLFDQSPQKHIHIKCKSIFHFEDCRLLVGEDISSILHSSQRLNDFHEAIINSSIVSRTDKKGTILFVNKNFEAISGYDNAELIGQNHRIINSDHHPKPFWTEMWKTIAAGKMWRADVKNRAKDGSFYWVDTMIIPLADETGKVREYLSIRNDITQRKLHKELLKQSERRFRLLARRLNLVIAVSKLGVWQLDLTNHIRTGDNRIKEIFGITDRSITTDEFWQMVHPEDREAKMMLYQSLSTFSTKEYKSEYRIIRTDGTLRYLLTQGVVFNENNGKLGTGISVVLDQTDQKLHEEKLVQSLHERDVLVKEIHHRVKNNLQLISSMLYLKSLTSDGSEFQTFLGDVREKIKSVSLIHERLLQTGSFDSIDIHDYLSKLLNDICHAYECDVKRIVIKADIEHHNFTSDYATYLGQFVNELILNALKHAFVGLKGGSITVKLMRQQFYFILTVEDDGVGVPEGVDLLKSRSYGMSLITIFARQLLGQLRMIRGRGTCFELRFKAE